MSTKHQSCVKIADVAVVFPVKLPIPRAIVAKAYQLLIFTCIIQLRSEAPPRRWHLHINFLTVPLISVLLLLATQCIDGTDVRRGILGADGVKPIDIMALFISLVSFLKLCGFEYGTRLIGKKAYISISLDATGLLRFLAFWVANKGGSSGKRLYFYLYMFFLVSGVVVGNVELSLLM